MEKDSTKLTGFISYTRKDQEHVDALREMLENQFTIDGEKYELWSDLEIGLGTKWRDEIFQNLKETDFSLLFLSNNFLATDFIRKEELPRFIERNEENQPYAIIPVLLKPCQFARFKYLEDLQVFVPRGSELGLKDNSPISFSHAYKEGSPIIDNYIIALFDKINNRLVKVLQEKAKLYGEDKARSSPPKTKWLW
ncbi:MAG: toll/interleukin-1 receptor domain-containing protein, partial [Bacteroidota bacterium]